MENKKYVFITGATSGIGLQTAKDLLSKGFLVFGTSRSAQKEDQAKKILGDDFHFIRGDLSSRKSVEQMADAAKNFLSGNGLYALVNNAGTFFSKHTLSEDGIEMQFAVNSAAPLYMSLLLYDEMRMAAGKIVNVNSSSHYGTLINWKDIQLQKHYGQLRAYKQTKAFSVLLSRKFNEYSPTVKMYMADPGLVSTEIGFKNTSALGKLVWSHRKSIGQTVEQGASTSVYLVSQNKLPDELYFKYSKPQPSSMATQNLYNAQKIWDYFTELYGIKPLEYLKG